jgi:hypothetical protein
MNICSSADLDWIEKDGLDKEDIKKILNEVDDKISLVKNHIFLRLLKNYVSGNPPVPKYNFLLGCSSVVYLVSEKYNKKILLLGDVHTPHNFENTKNSITCTSYFEKYFKSNTKLIDFFIEIPLFVRYPNLKTSELSYFFQKFIDCYNYKNCTFRLHATDIRELMNKDHVLNVLMPLVRALLNRNFNEAMKLSSKIRDIDNLHKYVFFTLINKTPLRKEINKINDLVLKRRLENFCQNSSSGTKIDGNKMFLDITKFQKNPNALETLNGNNNYIRNILNLLNPLIEGYTLARIFKRVEGLYNPEPKYIVIFQGDTHILDMINFLQYNDFKIKFRNHERDTRKIDISLLPQPIFED